MNVRKLLDWRKVLIYSHRWMGIAFGLLFISWFISGIAFMYWGMPTLSALERQAHQTAVDLSTATLTPIEAAKRNELRATSLRISMKSDRPVYSFGRAEVYADTGEPRVRCGSAAGRGDHPQVGSRTCLHSGLRQVS